MNANRPPQEVADGGGALLNVPVTWELRDLRDSKQVTLDEMPNSGEKNL